MKIIFASKYEGREVNIQLETQTPEEWAIVSKGMSEAMQFLTTTIMMQMKAEQK